MNREKKKNENEFVDSGLESSDTEFSGSGSESEDETPIKEGVHEVIDLDPAEAVLAGLRKSDNVPSHLFFSLFESSKSGFLFCNNLVREGLTAQFDRDF